MKNIKLFVILFSWFLVSGYESFSQNSKIKCYFNHPVNNLLSTGVNAVYLNGSFPDTIAAYIDRAKFTIDIALYNFTATSTASTAKIATAANNAFQRGVVIRWVFDSSSSNTGLTLLNPTIPKIGSPTSSSYGIMHNKFVVIDVNSSNANDAYIISGSYNWSPAQTITDYNNIIIIQDKNVALAYYTEFNKMWGGVGNVPDTLLSAFGTHKTTSVLQSFNVNGTDVQVHFSPKDNVVSYLKSAINTSNNELFFGIYAFTDNTVANLIKTKFTNGIWVRGIMDSFSQTYTPYATLSTLLGNNFILYNGTGLYHSKIMLVDALHPSSDPQVFTGSFNWSSSAQNSNDENALVIHDSIIANQYYQSLCKNFTDLGGIACIQPTLPIEWVSVEASTISNSLIKLDWKTTNEIDNDHFEIEHSIDGIKFKKIAIVNAIENGSAFHAYSYSDKNATDGINYYRIKQVDRDGNFNYSVIVFTKMKDEKLIHTFPNPASDYLYVDLPSKSQQLKVYNSIGLQIKTINCIGLANLKITLDKFSKGVYWIEVITALGKKTNSFVKF